MRRAALRNAARLLTAALVGLSASAAAGSQLVTLPVPTVTVYPGEVIDAGRLSEHTFVQAEIGTGYADSDAMLVGKVAKRTLLPDRPIPANALGEVDLVTRGTAVQLVFQQPGLTITAYASPLEAGSVGDMIRLRNTDSGAIVVGIVQADGTVRVGAR